MIALSFHHMKRQYLPVIPWFFMKYRWIFKQIVGIFSIFHEPLGKWNKEKNTKKITRISPVFLQNTKHCIILQLFDFQSS